MTGIEFKAFILHKNCQYIENTIFIVRTICMYIHTFSMILTSGLYKFKDQGVNCQYVRFYESEVSSLHFTTDQEVINFEL